MLSEKDLKQIAQKGISLDTVNQQIENFKRGFPFINLNAAATKEFGLVVFDKKQSKNLIDKYPNLIEDLSIVKMVPASGAASRMFKHLFEFSESYENSPQGHALFEKDQDFNSVYNFMAQLEKFAFFPDLEACMKKDGFLILEERKNKNYKLILDYLLLEKGLDYAKLPKGLLKFHNYPDANRYAIEEHLVEAAVYGVNESKKAHLHFTVSPAHQEKFENALEKVKSKYEDKYKITFEIDFSQQQSATDTIAVTPENEPFREKDGSILFRPGGHGALIQNLNAIDADVIFVKNIDNIVPDHIKQATFDYKKLIGSCLLETQNKIHYFLDLLEDGNIEDSELQEVYDFLQSQLFIEVPKYIPSQEKMEQIDWLYEQLNKPIRVCGMVKNEGEPGGGPFVVNDTNGNKSLQIVESSQIDFTKKDQAEIVKNATHFNPVDLVCAVKDFQGNKFDLTEFVDSKTGFISEKSKDGKTLKAQELPGLWNGAMANWITIFVEVPIITFNPVKTVNDLLRDTHQ
ncbi:MAG: NAD metabolism ATPase/kinase [Bacteroidetes bacterium 4572_77]|nr:MAG: NAD metabolism ATPase/kinase [Bacteroidetes bacterium 4572_77]